MALYYKSISNLFLLYKTYLEIFCRIVCNFLDEKILPLFINNGFSACRNITGYDRRLCQSSRQNKNKFIIYRETADFFLRLVDISSMSIEPNFVKFVFESYENGKSNINLDIERGKLIDFISACRILFFKNFE